MSPRTLAAPQDLHDGAHDAAAPARPPWILPWVRVRNAEVLEREGKKGEAALFQKAAEVKDQGAEYDRLVQDALRRTGP